MSTHQTKDGRWFVAFREKGSRAVKRKYFGRGLEGKAAAKVFESELLLQPLESRGQIAGAPITFGELAQKYLDARPLTKRTRESIGYALNLHVMPRFGETLVTQLSMSNLSEIDLTLAGLGRSLATRNRIRSYCKTICQWGVNNELTESNPFSRFKPETSKEAGAPDLVTQEEIQAIYKNAAPHLQWTLETMLNTGLRPGVTELFAIKISDIDWQREGLWVARTKTHEKNKSLLPLRKEFLEKIKSLVESEPKRKFLIEFEGKPVNSLKTAWHAAKKRAGVTRRLRLYDLRHWFATNLLAGGADLKAASELLGHSSPTTTLKTYYHLIERQKREAINMLVPPPLEEK